MQTFEIDTQQKKHCIDITDQVREAVARAGVSEGLCHVAVLHTTAAIIINENDDPNICVDFFRALDAMVPQHDGWLHDRVDNNAQSHILASLLGNSQFVPVHEGRLVLGTWQGIMLVELDGPRRARKVAVTVVPEMVAGGER